MQPAEDKKPAKPDKVKEVRKTTLAELGAEFPIGIPDDSGRLHKSFSVRPWRLKEERELGKLRASNEGISVGQWVSLVLATMCSRFGPHNFDEMKPEMKRVFISQCYMPDIFYAYLWLRRESLGSGFGFEIRCGNCGNRFPFTADLDSMEVRAIEEIKQAVWTYKLKAPITIRGKLIESFVLGPTKWNTLERMGSEILGVDTGAAKSGMIHGSIISLGELGEIPITENELDDLVKWDIEAISQEIDDKAVGPVMEVAGNCPRCNREFKSSIEWATDSFFAPPSP